MVFDSVSLTVVNQTINLPDTEMGDIVDKSKISEEERQQRSNRMIGNYNPRTKLRNFTSSDSSTHEVKKVNLRG